MKRHKFVARASNEARHAVRVIILLAALFPVFSYAQDATQAQSAPPQKAVTNLSPPTARYVFVQLSPVRDDEYMFDTQTGHLWNIRLKGKAMILVPVPYLDADGKTSMTPK